MSENHQEDLPTLPVGTVLVHGFFTMTVVRSSPGLAHVVDDDGDQWAVAWLDKAWRASSSGLAWEVQP